MTIPERRTFLRRPSAMLVAAMALSAGAALPAQERAPQAEAEPSAGSEGDRIGWHTVRPGETLEIITETYLGTTRLWEENWELNPDLKDPNLLRVGQRLRVILERQLPPRVAELTLLSNRVEQKPQPEPWITATVGSLLKERDGVRTYEKSSAKLRFDDDSELVINEESIVFLTEMVASVSGIKRETVEIVEGQAELETRVASRGRSEVEIIVGDARTRPTPGAAGTARTRAKRPESGGAAVMVFGGQAEVEAAGATVDVPTGMGTAVPEGGAPAPPERLLPAPVALAPSASSAWTYANPRFLWEGVDGAQSYVVEICAESACAELVDREELGQDTSWIPDALPVGSHFWRVSAVSASGLDGFPSQTRPLTIDSARVDVRAPAVAALVDGAGYVADSGTIWLGAGGGIVLAPHDDAAGIERVEYRWGDTEWTIYNGGPLRPPGSFGPVSLGVRAEDRLGRASRPWTAEVAVDRELPEAPTLEVGEREGQSPR